MSNNTPYFVIAITGNDPQAVSTDFFRGWTGPVFKEIGDTLDYCDSICSVPDFAGTCVTSILLK